MRRKAVGKSDKALNPVLRARHANKDISRDRTTHIEDSRRWKCISLRNHICNHGKTLSSGRDVHWRLRCCTQSSGRHGRRARRVSALRDVSTSASATCHDKMRSGCHGGCMAALSGDRAPPWCVSVTQTLEALFRR